MGRLGLATLYATIALTLAGHGQQREGALSSEYPAPRVREERQITVDGLIEIWQLKWASAPKSFCGARDFAMAITCPCQGFSYGEAGDLSLVRLRDGIELDRLHLTPFFNAWRGEAVVQRWPFYDKDFKEDDKRADFPLIVTKRATVQVMRFGDYDHDGRSQEFYLQTEALPCGKSTGVVIGLSEANPRLHVFGTASNPKKPLYLQQREWKALRDATGPVDVSDWTCADHGADTETRLRLRWTNEGISGVRGEYTCPSGGKAKRRMIREGPL